MAMKKFSPTRTITKANIEKVPSDKPGVYRIKDTKTIFFMSEWQKALVLTIV